MAGNKITRKDFIADDALNVGQDIAKGIQPAIDAMEKWLEVIKKSSIEYKKIGDQFKKAGSSKEFITTKKEEVQLSEQTTIALKEQQKAELNLIRTKSKLEQSTESTNRALIKERTALQATNKAIKDQAKEQLGLVGTYQKLNSKRTQAQKTLQNLLSADKQNVRQIKIAQKEYAKLNTRVLAVDRATNNYTKNIGNYRSALGGLTGSFRSLVSALGLASGIFAFVQVMRNGIKIIRDYGKANATLSAVLQVTKSEMSDLREESQRLGAVTVKTANEIVGLQIAYARLGFAQKEIIDLTELTIQGSIAMNSGLSETAKLTGAVINSMDEFSTTDAGQVLDILALSTARSALDFEKLSIALPKVLGAANALKIPFTEVTATLGKLTDAGIEASTAGTSLRKIFISAAKRGIDYKEALDKIRVSTEKVKTANEVFGTRAAVSALLIAKNAESVDILDESLNNAAGTIESMANKELDTLDGALQLLKSAWQGIVLGTDDANSISTKLKETLQFLAKNLKTIVIVLGRLIGIFIAYKALVIAVGLAQKAVTAYTIAYRIAVVSLNRGLLSAIKSMRLFKAALTTTGIGIAVVAITALVYAFTKLNVSLEESIKATNESTEAYLKTRIEQEKQAKVVDDLTSKYEGLTDGHVLNNKEQKELDRIIKLLAKDFPLAVTEVDKYGNAIAISTIKVKELNKANKESLFGGQREKTLLKENENQLKRLIAQQSRYNNVLEDGKGFYVEGVGAVASYNGVLKTQEIIQARSGNIIKEGNALTSAQIDLVSEAIKKNEEEIEQKKGYIATLKDEIKAREEVETSTVNNKKTTIEEVKALEKLRNELSGLKENLNDLTANGYDSLTESQAQSVVETRKLIASKQREIDAILGTTKALKDNSKERERIAKKQRQDAFNLAKFTIKESIKGFDEIAKSEETSLSERLGAIKLKASEELKLATLVKEFKLEKVKEGSNAELLILAQFEAEKKRITGKREDGEDGIEAIKIAQNAAKEKAIREKALADTLRGENELFKKEIAIADNKEAVIEAHERRIAEIKKKYALEGLNAQIDALKVLIAATEEGSLERIEAEKRLAQAQLAISNITTEQFIINEDTKTEKIKLSTEEILQISNDLTQALGDLANSLFDRKIQNIDEEIQQLEDSYSKQLELAQGDDEQTKLLEIEQEKRRQELEKKKRKEQRKQAILNKALAVVEVAINTAIAVSKVWGQTGIFGLAAQIPVLIMGALQTAAIIATPIPKYAKGTDNHFGGYALVAEERPEVIQEPNKMPYVQKTPAILDLPKHTKVTRSVEDYNKLLKSSMLTSIETENNKLNSFYSRQIFDVHNKELLNEMQLTRKAIEKNKTNIYVQQQTPIDFEHELFKLNNTNWG